MLLYIEKIKEKNFKDLYDIVYSNIIKISTVTFKNSYSIRFLNRNSQQTSGEHRLLDIILNQPRVNGTPWNCLRKSGESGDI